MLQQFFISLLVVMISFASISIAEADEDVISLFPLDHYDQTISNWIKPNDPNYDTRLITEEMQARRLSIFYDHYFGPLSPWDSNYVTQILKSSPDSIKKVEQSILEDFSNKGKTGNDIGYGENFRPYSQNWIDNITDNINLSALDQLQYRSNNRAIAVDNLAARELPTVDPHYYSYKIAGQGYPFDNLQVSAIWAGTPLYIIAETKDQEWMLVITPDFIAWVKTNGIARVDTSFVNIWQSMAKNKLVAITKTKTAISDHQKRFLFSAYIGSVFPATKISNNIDLLVPVKNLNQYASIKSVSISAQSAELMPLPATRHQFVNLMHELLGRPYGWGGLYFNNDCSAELKSLFTPFGIWLPRHSSDQVTVGKEIDLSAASQEQRLSYLMQNGEPFLTVIYIGGHVILYIGNYPDPRNSGTIIPMSFQNIWGLKPNPPIRRAVIGESVLFPLLAKYPEDPSLVSLAGKPIFQMALLDQFPVDELLMKQGINLKALMSLPGASE